MHSNVRKILVPLVIFFVLVGIVFVIVRSLGDGGTTTSFDWQSDWAVAEGFSISPDSDGYSFPTAIVFVPEPGPNPGDPLYFVTELRGTLKVVTNDRQVHNFATELFDTTNLSDLPSVEGEVGMAGLCLAPDQGYVFATFTYKDVEGVYRNNVVRFETTPQQFSTIPTEQVVFSELFAPYTSSVSHQIGSCQVHEDLLYISVGDGFNSGDSRQIDTFAGKILRMTLDGQPVSDNPFLENDRTTEAANFVWAYGFRNPFGLEVIANRVFVADNGIAVDRFLEVRPGTDYLWDGTVWSFGANADFLFDPGRGVVQMDYYPDESDILPEFLEQNFFIAISGNLTVTPDDKEKQEIPGVVMLEYDLQEQRVPTLPEFFVRYPGSGTQMVVGVGFGFV